MASQLLENASYRKLVDKDIDVARRIISNILEHPQDSKFRKIKVSKLSKIVKNKYLCVNVLKEIGFVIVNDKLILNDDISAGDKSLLTRLMHISQDLAKLKDLNRSNMDYLGENQILDSLSMEDVIQLIPKDNVKQILPVLDECKNGTNVSKHKHDIITKYVYETPLATEIKAKSGQNMNIAHTLVATKEHFVTLIMQAFGKEDAERVIKEFMGDCLTDLFQKPNFYPKMLAKLKTLRDSINKQKAMEYKNDQMIWKKLLSKQKQAKGWQCFLCKNKNNVTDNNCSQCKMCCNPLFPAFQNLPRIRTCEGKWKRLSNSSFSVDKDFGVVCLGKERADFRNKLAKFDECHSKSDCSTLRVTVIFSEIESYEIRNDSTGGLTKRDVKKIVCELLACWKTMLCRLDKEDNNLNLIQTREFRVVGQICFTSKHEFSQLKDSDIIRAREWEKPYQLTFGTDFVEDTDWHHVAPRMKLRFGSEKTLCPMVVKSGSCMMVDIAREVLSDSTNQADIDVSLIYVVDHLRTYNHFSTHPYCPRKKNQECPSLVNALKDKDSILDALHLLFYKHNIGSSRIKKTNDSGTGAFQFHNSLHLTRINKMMFLDKSNPEMCTFWELIKEVVSNGFERDLLPTDDDVSFENVQKIAEQINKVDILDLKTYYGLFSTVEEKLHHQRHGMMGNVLNAGEMLALVLYCNADCNYDLSRAKIWNENPQKWTWFNRLLNLAINKLACWESRNQFIYSGATSVYLNPENLGWPETDNPGFISLKCAHSFSTDLQVAKEFAGAAGMIIAIKLTSDIVPNASWRCCDVSWISKYEAEKEVLVQEGSCVRVNVKNIHKRDTMQYIIASTDPFHQEISFEEAFLNHMTDSLSETEKRAS